MGWVFLGGAIATEVAATLSLKATVEGSRWWYAVVVVGYVASFALLRFALGRGVPLAVAYGIWSAIGIALTALVSWLAFHEAMSARMIAGLVLIIAGVWLLETGSSPEAA